MRTPILAFVLVLALVGTVSAQPTTPDPCALVTQAEVKAALGIEVGTLKIDPQMNPAAGKLCSFEVGDVGFGGIGLRTLSAVETPQKIRAENEKVKIETSDATGFGAGAFYAVSSGVVQLNAFKGSTHVIVQLMLMTSPPDKVREALAKLMHVVLPKLK
jgi:hypothetical protein